MIEREYAPLLDTDYFLTTGRTPPEEEAERLDRPRPPAGQHWPTPPWAVDWPINDPEEQGRKVLWQRIYEGPGPFMIADDYRQRVLAWAREG